MLTDGRLLYDIAATSSTDSQFYDLMGDEIKWSFQDDVRRYAHLAGVENNGACIDDASGNIAPVAGPEARSPGP